MTKKLSENQALLNRVFRQKDTSCYKQNSIVVPLWSHFGQVDRALLLEENLIPLNYSEAQLLCHLTTPYEIKPANRIAISDEILESHQRASNKKLSENIKQALKKKREEQLLRRKLRQLKKLQNAASALEQSISKYNAQ